MTPASEAGKAEMTTPSSTNRPKAPIPTFAAPPVTEVAVAVSYRSLDKLTVLAASELWRTQFAPHFPKTEEQPVLITPTERFNGAGQTLSIPMFFGTETQLPRLWFLTEDGEELLQLQRDWFACNWRKVSPASEYGRWPSRRAAFLKWFGLLDEYVRTKGLGEIKPVQCEVTYVNHVDLGAEGHGGLDKIIRLAGTVEGGLLPTPEQMGVSAQYVIPGQGGPLGRLYVVAQPGFRRDDNAPILVLTITARGKPEGEGLDGVMRFLDRGRDWADHAFVETTTEDIQRKWGRHD